MSSSIAISPVSATTHAAAEHQVLPAQEQEGYEQPENQLLPIQCRLSVGAPDDPMEEEADDMADKVMRMPEPGFIQRKCAHCEEEEKAQRKPLASFIQMKGSDSGTATSEAVSQQISASRGTGSVMDQGTKRFMESRFDTDFSSVNIHTGSTAVQLSAQLNAQAFTIGNDIYFNEGKYSPGSDSGKHLLAHELTHTIQQQGAYPDLAQRSPEVCPPRPSAERASSERPEGILPVNIVTTSDSIIIQDFAVNSATIPRNVTNSMDWQRLMSDIAGNPATRMALQGHTDCVGSDVENIMLREQRVASVTAAMPPAAQTKVVFSFTSAEEFLDTNLTAEGRARNRSVRIVFRAMEDEVAACDQLSRASNLDELIFLVRCAEERLGLTSGSDGRLFISALRQIYYGNASWTIAGNRNRVWNDVIDQRPWSPSVDPHDRLGDNLFNALRRSQVVSNIDFGHLLTGLDAMFNPHDVELDFGRAVFVTGLINEEWATWAGDVGSAAATWAEESLYAQADAEIGSIFNRLASPADLRGNIDSFAIRQGIMGIADPALALAHRLTLNARLSEVLQNYYRITGSGLGRRRSSRISDFIRAYGGIITGSIIDNKNELADTLLPSVQEFAFMFFMQNLLRRGFFADDHPPAHSSEYLSRGVEYMTMEFIDWLEANM